MDFGSPLLRLWSNARPPPPEHADMGQENSESEQAAEQQAPESTGAGDSARKRLLQCVSTKAQKVRVLKWMVAQVATMGSETKIISCAVRNFPEVFRGCRYQSNIQKCSRWWRNRVQLLEEFELLDNLSLSHTYLGNRKRVELKARPGRGRKPAGWCTWLYPLVRIEFDRLRKSGVKFSPQVLLLMAKNVFLSNPHPTFQPSTVLPDSDRSLIDRITPRWIQQFQETQGIVHRTQTGKLSVSKAKTEFIERSTAYHMGQLHRGFASGELNEDLMENMDETHFIVNMDNKRTLGFRGDTEVKYADVVSGGMGITMVVKVSGGKHGKIGIPFLIFLNANCSYPIRGTPDNIPGVAYRTSKKSFMTNELLAEYYRERRVNWADPSGRRKVQWVDNCPGHNLIPETYQALDRISTEVRFFPANSTHLTQPCDSFVISKIKDAWRRRWDAKKMEMIQNEMWQGDGRAGTSGALKNPGWTYFLQLAADCVRDVNGQVDKKYGMSYARRAMIRCGLSLNSRGVWNVKQLTPELQEIITKYKGNFEGSREGLPGGESSLLVQQVPPGIPLHIPATVTDGLRVEPSDTDVDGGPEDGISSGAPCTDAFQDAQPYESVDPDAAEHLTVDSELWGFLESNYNV